MPVGNRCGPSCEWFQSDERSKTTSPPSPTNIYSEIFIRLLFSPPKLCVGYHSQGVRSAWILLDHQVCGLLVRIPPATINFFLFLLSFSFFYFSSLSFLSFPFFLFSFFFHSTVFEKKPEIISTESLRLSICWYPVLWATRPDFSTSSLW